MYSFATSIHHRITAIATLTICAMSASPLFAADESQQPKPQVILLKLDDVVARPSANGPVAERWQRIADYLTENGIRGSFGVICESLEADNPAYFQWIKDIQAGGFIEIWMHGYHLKTADEPGEFEQGTAAEQQAILEKSARLAREKLGFPLAAFGPHWSGTTDATDEALEAVPDIKIWLYGPAKPKYFTRLSLPRVLALENPTFVPDPIAFKALYEKFHAADRDVLVLQGHPAQWDDQRWAGFLEIIKFLKSKGVVFMTPSEYLASRKVEN